MNLDYAARWITDCLQEGGELTLADAVGSYHVWLIAARVHDRQHWPEAVQRRTLTSPPAKDREDGKRLLRKLGYPTTRQDGPTRFVGISLRTQSGKTAAPASGPDTGRCDPDDAMYALALLADLAAPADLDAAWIDLTRSRSVVCTRCGRITRHLDSKRHIDCRRAG